MSDPAPRFRDSAVVVLVRGRGDALETWWARRSDAVPTQPGFESFIGGKVEAADLDLPIEGDLLPDEERARRCCAIREAFEEAGVLVALASPAEPAAFLEARRRLLAGEASFLTLARQHGWRFRSDALDFAGRWQTPPFTTARFEASYYLARVPEGQEPSIHEGELVAGEWIAPLAALDRWRHGHATFAAPILWTLIALAEGETDLAARLAGGPERAGQPVRRIELRWGIVLHPMKTRPLPPATHTNCYLVGEREMAVVDPGSAEPAELDQLFLLIDALAKEGRRPKLLLLTHHHVDHTGGVEAVRARCRIPVAAHAEAAKHLRLDFTLKDGDWVPLVPGIGDWNLRVLHTPGHTRDHLCFFHPRTRSLLTGDHIPGGTGTVIIDPPDGDMAAYVASLERLLGEGVEALFPGHGSPQGGAARRIRGLIEHRREREAKVLAALGPEPRAIETLVEAAYDDTPGALWEYAARSLLAHLLKLEAEGRAAREGEKWRRA